MYVCDALQWARRGALVWMARSPCPSPTAAAMCCWLPVENTSARYGRHVVLRSEATQNSADSVSRLSSFKMSPKQPPASQDISKPWRLDTDTCTSTYRLRHVIAARSCSPTRAPDLLSGKRLHLESPSTVTRRPSHAPRVKHSTYPHLTSPLHLSHMHRRPSVISSHHHAPRQQHNILASQATARTIRHRHRPSRPP